MVLPVHLPMVLRAPSLLVGGVRARVPCHNGLRVLIQSATNISGPYFIMKTSIQFSLLQLVLCNYLLFITLYFTCTCSPTRTCCSSLVMWLDLIAMSLPCGVLPTVVYKCILSRPSFSACHSLPDACIQVQECSHQQSCCQLSICCWRYCPTTCQMKEGCRWLRDCSFNWWDLLHLIQMF